MVEHELVTIAVPMAWELGDCFPKGGTFTVTGGVWHTCASTSFYSWVCKCGYSTRPLFGHHLTGTMAKALIEEHVASYG